MVAPDTASGFTSAVPAAAVSRPGVDIADNLQQGTVRALVEPLFEGSSVTIITGYQDFLSAMALIAELADLDQFTAPGSIRLLFGTNTAASTRLHTSKRKLSVAAREHFLRKGGIYLQDAADLAAVQCLEALRSGAIEIRMYAGGDESSANRLFHAKAIVGAKGSVLGSANFSRAGLSRNVELVDSARFGSARDTARREAADRFWELGTDWRDEAIEILSQLLKGVSPDLAMARIVAELRGFPLWQPPVRGRLASLHALLPYQRDLVYEAVGLTYEHGLAFVEAPPGAGKTVIGQLVALLLSDTYAAVFDRRSFLTRDSARASPVILAPPAVETAWRKGLPIHAHFLRTSELSGAEDQEDDETFDAKVAEASALIIDEAHNLATRWRQESVRARRFEEVKGVWTCCLSATLVGNHGLDTFVTLQERRGSPYMTPDFCRRMNDLIERQLAQRAMESEDLPGSIVAEAADEMARFVCRRSRHSVGPKPEGSTYPVQALGYPEFRHTRIDLLLSERDHELVAQIDGALAVIEHPTGGRRGHREDVPTRLGASVVQRINLAKKAARDVRMLLRVCNAVARWEVVHGKFAKYLKPRAAASLFPDETREERAGRGRDLRERIETFAAGPLDDQRVEKLCGIARRHHCVLFIGERLPVLQYYAEKLEARLGRSGFEVYVAASKLDAKFQKGCLSGGSGKVQRLVGTAASAKLQALFDAGAVEREPKVPKRLGFVHLQRAEGINTQLACAVVLLGVGADVRMLRQAIGRIDRINSPHPRVHYYTLTLDGFSVPSDRAGPRRLEEASSFTHGAHGTALDSIERVDIVEALLENNSLPRQAHDRNFFDQLWRLEAVVPAGARKAVEGAPLGGPWGVDLVHLRAARRPCTVFCLRGVVPGADRREFGPPRLMLFRDDGTDERDQAAVVRELAAAYAATRDAGLADAPSRWADDPLLLKHVQTNLRRLTPWCLRPARTEGLLESLARFISDGEESAFEQFAALSLGGLELLCAEWLRVLDPAWRFAKQDQREMDIQMPGQTSGLLFGEDDALAGASGHPWLMAGADIRFPGYLDCGRILETLLHGDPAEVKDARARMDAALEAAEALSEGAETELWSRVGVVVRVSPLSGVPAGSEPAPEGVR